MNQHINGVSEELWKDGRKLSHEEILGSIIRSELNKEKVVRIDLTYLSLDINNWWSQKNIIDTEKINLNLLAELKILISKLIKPEHFELISKMGLANQYLAAILFENVFSQPDKNLALYVHEAFTDLAKIVDIKYPYEEPKELFPKNTQTGASDWGKGYGIIRPHSDDIYEFRDINAMCLTVCKDTSSTPTWFWLLKDVVSDLTDEELGKLAFSEAIFTSGTNVEGTNLESKKSILRMDSSEGVTLRLDFRIDDSVGPRMRFEGSDAPQISAIIEKMRNTFKKLKPLASKPNTGSVGLLSNFKILHGRSALNPVMLYEGESSRILFRSKGIRAI
jgi:hypothetical protein